MTATRKARAVVHGAISIVNAIATGKGSALGISLKVIAEVELQKGHGLRVITGRNGGDKLIKNVIQKTIPKQIIESNMIIIKVDSEIPVGYGLKSSSAVSNAVALACSQIEREEDINDYAILEVAVSSSLEAKVSLTGAYDDATACYFGGFTVTDNYSRRLIRKERAPENLNGVLASAALSSSYTPVIVAMEHGALSASISGNGPSIAAVGYQEAVESIVDALSKFEGKIIVSKVNNEKANVKIIND